MWTLGIKPSYGNSSPFNFWGYHDGGACILDGDHIVAIAEEERFTREKHAPHTFPQESIRYVLREANIDIDDVDVIAIGRDPKLESKGSFGEFRDRRKVPTSGEDFYHFFHALEDFVASRLGYHVSQVEDSISEAVGGSINADVHMVSHHLCHATSAAYCSPSERPVTITIDGRGEYESTVLWDGDLNRVREFPRTNSAGKLYSRGTEYLGFRGRRDAGKVMGLASYGAYRDDFAANFEELVEIGNGRYDVTAITHPENFIEIFERHFGTRRQYPEAFEDYHKDFACHLQLTTENILTELIQWLVRNQGERTIAISGGVAMNCKANRAALQLDCVDDLFIQPAANDAGICLGAALEGYRRKTGNRPAPNFKHVYHGPSYSNQQIRESLENYKVEYEHCEDVCRTGATLLADGELVGWFQGRMEFGARALGNRSILADPRREDSLDLVNKNVKDREPWRPFAPSLLSESRQEYLKYGDESPYMILLDEVREDKRSEVPAIVHTDGTCRPQTVSKETNPKYYRLIKEFEDITGVPVVLNTSFNVSGEPIVESPAQAVRDFYSTGLDALVIGDFLLRKAG